MIVEHMQVGPLGCNCVILGDEATKEAIVLDPGGEVPRILKRLRELGLHCKAIAHTHTHFDHVGGAQELQDETGAPIMMHEKDLFLYEGLQMQLDAFRIPFRAPETGEVDRFLKEGDVLRAGQLEAGVLHTPGHTPGSLCFTIAGASVTTNAGLSGAQSHADTSKTTVSHVERPVLIAGDTLFEGSIGRTDLWGGDASTIQQSIRKKLLTLPDETYVITGHGASTTIGQERHSNPYIQG